MTNMALDKPLEELLKELKEARKDDKGFTFIGGEFSYPKSFSAFLDALPKHKLCLAKDFDFKTATHKGSLIKIVISGELENDNIIRRRSGDLTAEAESDGLKIKIKPFEHAEVSFQRASLTFKAKDAEEPDVSVAVKFTEGTTRLGEGSALEIPIQGEWQGDCEIGLAAGGRAKKKKPIAEVAKLFGWDDLSVVLPQKVADLFEELELSQAEFVFDLRQQRSTLARLASETNKHVTLVEPTLKVEKIGIRIEAEFERYAGKPIKQRDEITHARASRLLEVFGTLQIGGTTFTIAMTQYSKHGAMLTVLEDEESKLPDLVAVANWIVPDGFGKWVEQQIDELKEARLGLKLDPLEQLQVAFDPSKGQLHWLSISGGVSSIPSIGDSVPHRPIHFRSSLRLQPRKPFSARFLLGLDQTKSDGVDLAGVLAVLIDRSRIDVAKWFEATLTDYRIEAAPAEKRYAIALEAKNLRVRLGAFDLSLVDVAFDWETVDSDYSLGGRMIFKVAEIPLLIEAHYDSEKKDFRFKSGFPAIKDVRLGSFLEWFDQTRNGDRFKTGDAPSLTVKDLFVEFSTASKRLEFSAEFEGDKKTRDPFIHHFKGLLNVVGESDSKTGLTFAERGKVTGKLEGSVDLGATAKFKTTYGIGKKVISGELEVATDPLNIEDLIRAYADQAAILSKWLDFGLVKVTLKYEFDKGNMIASATANAWDATAFLRRISSPEEDSRIEDPTKVWVAGIEFEKVSLRRLPFIGEALRDLDFIQFDPLRFIRASEALKDYEMTGGKFDVYKGWSLQGRFKIGDGEEVFNKRLFAPKTETGLIRESETADERLLRKTMWLEVNRNIGAVQIRRVGFQFGKGSNDTAEKPKIRLMTDAGVKVSALEIHFYGLSIAFEPKSQGRTEFQVECDGLQIQFKMGDSFFGHGGFLRIKEGGAGETNFVGEVGFLFNEVGFTGFGGYMEGEGKWSMFGFIFASVALGNPTLKVTGLALGAGFNREVQMPELSKLKDFPLIKVANRDEDAPDLRKIHEAFPISFGNDWATAGVRLTIVEMIDVSALLLMSAGTQLEIQLLGVGSFKRPKKEPVINIELLFQAGISWNGNQRKAVVSGVLTDKSYLLIEDAKLSGGFAFCKWWTANGAQEVNDWVFSSGGYHPAFKAPSYYPKLPASGFSVKIGENTHLKLKTYLAMTQACLMLGGDLELAYILKNRFEMYLKGRLDVLVHYQPFLYDVALRVNASISVQITLIVTKTITARFGIGLNLKGPKLRGMWEVKICGILFRGAFGEQQPVDKEITWENFKAAYLEPPSKLMAPSGYKRSQICQVQIAQGLIKELYEDEDQPQKNRILVGWVVDPAEAVVTTISGVPAKKAFFNGRPVGHAVPEAFGVGMVKAAAKDFRSQLKVTLTKLTVDSQAVKPEAIYGSVPRSLWDPDLDIKVPPAAGAKSVIYGVLTGLRFGGKAEPAGAQFNVDTGNLQNKDKPLDRNLGRPRQRPKVASGDPMDRLKRTIDSEQVHQTRARMLGKLSDAGFAVEKEVSVQQFKDGEHELTAPPQLSRWVDLP